MVHVINPAPSQNFLRPPSFARYENKINERLLLFFVPCYRIVVPSWLKHFSELDHTYQNFESELLPFYGDELLYYVSSLLLEPLPSEVAIYRVLPALLLVDIL